MRNRNIDEILESDIELFKNMGDSWGNNLRVACPGIIQSFDPESQTVTVQLALREHIYNGYDKQWIKLPLLLDVPIIIPRAGNYVLTMPIKKDDECLVIFADMCIDAWYSYGGIQNQIEKRRHDLSDGFAILGAWSQPNKIEDYSTDSCQLRTIDGTTAIDIKPGEINMNASSVRVNGKDVLTREV
ncbi:hypothetical protein HYH85_17965 [Clostridium botulinum]|uniref:Gp138 family membrane-puncturing spike protein n=1 Tax=Clostridium botulinum TaxID=1491 RepID=UPI001C9B4A1D|nr:Gp138 family membrane-puncturing spike protein [Clostridium botulinum]MBY6798099.1 hypothetical protein [Clostridium botulinum]MBY6867848.1 hypothetical protein [Clostridium botulinum]